MTTAQVVETSVTVNNNSPIQDYVHPDDQTQPFKAFPCKIDCKIGGHLHLGDQSNLGVMRHQLINKDQGKLKVHSITLVLQ